jgi:hypothetical protein
VLNCVQIEGEIDATTSKHFEDRAFVLTDSGARFAPEGSTCLTVSDHQAVLLFGELRLAHNPGSLNVIPSSRPCIVAFPGPLGTQAVARLSVPGERSAPVAN